MATNYITCRNFGTILIWDKKGSESKTVRNFEMSEIFTYTVQLIKLLAIVAPKLLVSFMGWTLVETLLDMRNV